MVEAAVFGESLVYSLVDLYAFNSPFASFDSYVVILRLGWGSHHPGARSLRRLPPAPSR